LLSFVPFVLSFFFLPSFFSFFLSFFLSLFIYLFLFFFLSVIIIFMKYNIGGGGGGFACSYYGTAIGAPASTLPTATNPNRAGSAATFYAAAASGYGGTL
jgi:hypothetical protein